MLLIKLNQIMNCRLNSSLAKKCAYGWKRAEIKWINKRENLMVELICETINNTINKVNIDNTKSLMLKLFLFLINVIFLF